MEAEPGRCRSPCRLLRVGRRRPCPSDCRPTLLVFVRPPARVRGKALRRRVPECCGYSRHAEALGDQDTRGMVAEGMPARGLNTLIHKIASRAKDLPGNRVFSR